MIVSYIAWPSTAFDAFGADERYGSPTCRASCPLATAALKYSGRPNAGAPDFMSTLDVNAPYITGAPGRTAWVNVMPASASACWSVRAPASATGALAPARGDGVTTESWPAAAKSMSPMHIGMSSCRGELLLMTV